LSAHDRLGYGARYGRRHYEYPAANYAEAWRQWYYSYMYQPSYDGAEEYVDYDKPDEYGNSFGWRRRWPHSGN